MCFRGMNLSAECWATILVFHHNAILCLFVFGLKTNTHCITPAHASCIFISSILPNIKVLTWASQKFIIVDYKIRDFPPSLLCLYDVIYSSYQKVVFVLFPWTRAVLLTTSGHRDSSRHMESSHVLCLAFWLDGETRDHINKLRLHEKGLLRSPYHPANSQLTLDM